MKKIKLIFILSFAATCAFCQSGVLERVAKKGIGGLNYKFSDNGNRSVNIYFANDTTVEVSNKTSIAHNHHLLNFNAKYRCKMVKIGTLVIYNQISSDKALRKNEYLKPYDNRPFTLDGNSINYIFPDVDGDTLRFSSDFKKLQVREFSFEKN